MLKKLVKYGNSNALILDRAILELLGIGEGSMVKLHTDGKSLTITPEKASTHTEVSMTGTERVQEFLENKKSSAQATVSKEKLDADAQRALQQAVKKIMDKYSDAITGYDHQAFLVEVDALAEKYDGDLSTRQKSYL